MLEIKRALSHNKLFHDGVILASGQVSVTLAVDNGYE